MGYRVSGGQYFLGCHRKGSPAASTIEVRSSVGFWHRVASTTQLQNIQYFMSVSVVNEETELVIVPRALKAVGVTDRALKAWPGTDVTVGMDGEEGEAAKALIGSPNGLAPGYFLLQHKRQLGGTKFIWKIRIFKDDGALAYPNLLFYVDPNAPPSKPEKPSSNFMERNRTDAGVESRVVERSKDGKSMLQEHVVRARLYWSGPGFFEVGIWC
ncbi:hypothetical protein CC86DRAFT_416671, partial [Ophiobolus disseminans]